MGACSNLYSTRTSSMGGRFQSRVLSSRARHMSSRARNSCSSRLRRAEGSSSLAEGKCPIWLPGRAVATVAYAASQLLHRVDCVGTCNKGFICVYIDLSLEEFGVACEIAFYIRTS